MSQPIPIPVFRVREVTSEYGGLGRLIGIFSTQENADAAAKGQGWWGSDGNIEPLFAIPDEAHPGRFFILIQADSVQLDLNLPQIEAELKAGALAKLSPEEKAVLGLKS